MGAYVSVSDCQRDYNVTINCTAGSYNNITHKFASLGDITRGQFQGDPDIAGVGILGVFLAVTSFALFMSVLDIVWQACKTFKWKTTQTKEQKRLKSKKRSVSDIMEALVQACSDQQIFTGAAYALTLRYWRGCSISAYHYNIVANILLLTCTTHLMSVTIVRNYWKYPGLAFVRVLCVTGVFILTGVLMSNQNADDNPDVAFPTAVPPTNETDSLIFLPAACFQGNGTHLTDTFAQSTSSSEQFFVNAIGKSEPKNKIQGWRWYLIILFWYGAAVIAEAIRFLRRGQTRPGFRARLAQRVGKHFETGTRVRSVIKYVFLFYLVAGIGLSFTTVIFTGMYIFNLRAWVDRSGWLELSPDSNMNPENDATSFGQLVPIFLSALILFSFLQTFSEKVTDHENRKHFGDEKPPQVGRIGYFDPYHYDLMSLNTDTAYQGATPGTVDLETGQPWPANKPVRRRTDSLSAATPGAGNNVTSPLLDGANNNNTAPSTPGVLQTPGGNNGGKPNASSRPSVSSITQERYSVVGSPEQQKLQSAASSPDLSSSGLPRRPAGAASRKSTGLS